MPLLLRNGVLSQKSDNHLYTAQSERSMEFMELDWVTKDFKNARIPPFLSPFNKNYLDLFNEEEFSELSKNVYEVLCEIQMFNRRISL